MKKFSKLPKMPFSVLHPLECFRIFTRAILTTSYSLISGLFLLVWLRFAGVFVCGNHSVPSGSVALKFYLLLCALYCHENKQNVCNGKFLLQTKHKNKKSHGKNSGLDNNSNTNDTRWVFLVL